MGVIPSNRLLDPTWQAGPAPDPVPGVVDASRRNDLPTGYVTVTAPAGATDRELANVAGYDMRRQYGYTVTRHGDGSATVALWND